jgi:hypothetical protein
MFDTRAARRAWLVLLAGLGWAQTGRAQAPADDVAAVQAVVESAYVRGVHAQFDPAAVRRGFHPDFRMLLLRDGKLEALTLDAWIARMEKRQREQPPAAPPKVSHSFTFTDVVGHAASVRVELHRDGRHVFSDYLSLYKFADGWKIVSKTFYAYP